MFLGHTTSSGVVRLNIDGFGLAVLHNDGIPLASHATEDGRAVKAEIHGFGENAGGITEKSDLLTCQTRI